MLGAELEVMIDSVGGDEMVEGADGDGSDTRAGA